MVRKHMKQVPVVRDFMATNLVTLKPGMKIYDAIKVLLKNRISGAPVVDGDHHVVGVLSEKDCLRLFANGALYILPGGIVEDYMSKDLTTVDPDEGIFSVAEIFLRNTFRRLPVVEDGKLVGQVSRRDVLIGSLNIWEESPVEKAWTDSNYIPEQVQAALSNRSTRHGV